MINEHFPISLQKTQNKGIFSSSKHTQSKAVFACPTMFLLKAMLPESDAGVCHSLQLSLLQQTQPERILGPPSL